MMVSFIMGRQAVFHKNIYSQKLFDSFYLTNFYNYFLLFHKTW